MAVKQKYIENIVGLSACAFVGRSVAGRPDINMVRHREKATVWDTLFMRGMVNIIQRENEEEKIWVILNLL